MQFIETANVRIIVEIDLYSAAACELTRTWHTDCDIFRPGHNLKGTRSEFFPKSFFFYILILLLVGNITDICLFLNIDASMYNIYIPI